MNEFFTMGGYAAFVWPAYGITALVMVGLLVDTLRRLRVRRRRLEQLESEEGISRRGAS
jgi:heme exporter protein D